MGLNTYPCNPFPPSTDQMDADTLETDVSKLESDVDQLKSGLTNVADDVKLNTNDLTTPSRTKNLLLIDLPMIKAFNAQGTWDGNSYTRANVTYTLNFDGNGNLANVTVNGTASADGSLKLVLQKDLPLKAGSQYIVSGSTGGSANTYAIDCEGFAASQDGESEPFTYNTSHPNYYILIAVKEGVSLNNKVFYPMVRLASDTDPTFAPYIPSVESRIEAVESYTAVNTIYKPEQRAWSGNSLVYNIPLNSSNMIHFIACQTNVRDTFVEAYFVLREQTQAIIVQKSSEGLTLTYDSTTKKTTVTLPETGYWIERMEMCARSVS